MSTSACAWIPGTNPLAMHAPDGLFSLSVNVVFAAVVVVLLSIAATTLARQRDHRLVPLMGIMAAFVFAAQMVNFPIASGTTGHLLGGTLAAILLGPWAGTLVMSVVVFFQALLADGGITVLGPNIFNMGIVGTCLGYYVYRAAVGNALAPPARVVAASFFAAWTAVVLASVFVSLQLAVSGTASLDRALLAMVGTHMVIGIGEALITAFVVAFVLKTRPDLLYAYATDDARPVGRPVILVGLGAALVVAALLSLLPTLWGYPDGLESVGIEKGFLFEEPQVAADGTLETLPAYPLGVRLRLVDGKVTAVHRYDSRAAALADGDVVEQIGSTPIPDLSAAAAVLRFDRDARTFAIGHGDALPVVVRRAGQRQELVQRALAAPRAGTLAPLVAVLHGYAIPGLTGVLSTSLAGAVGALIMFIASFLVGRALVRPSRLAQAVAHASDS